MAPAGRSPASELVLIAIERVQQDHPLYAMRGTTALQQEEAVALMLEKPTVIKRPVVESGKTLLNGFAEAEYAKKLG